MAIEIRKTACNRDCPDACSILVTVEDGRAVSLRGNPDDPLTRGFLCERTNRFLDRQYADDRFTQPMLRRNGRLEPVSWDVALDLAAAKLTAARRDHGPASILHYKSGGSLGILKALTSHFFEQFGPVTIKRGDICSGAGEAAQERDFGVSESSDIHDILDSRCIILWGKNVHTSGPHLLPILNEARRLGAKIVGIDPVRTQVARLSDVFVSPRPGADFALAMAIARWLFDADAVDPEATTWCNDLPAFRDMARTRTVDEWALAADVEPADARRLAAIYAGGKPATILIGWGLARRRNGAATVRALDALGMITGNVGIPGGSVSYNFARQGAFDLGFVRGAAVAPRTFAEARLGHEILAARDPAVRVLWVTAGNPVTMLPDSNTMRAAIRSVDFTVVVDTHPTDTTDLADLVLPCLTLLEDDDLLGAYGNHQIRSSTPALAPLGDARHELHIFQDLAARVGLTATMAGSVDDWKRRVTSRLADGGVTIEQLRDEPVRNPFAAKVLFAGRRFATADGKANLMTEPAAAPPTTTSEFPFTVLAISTPKAQSSQWMRKPDGPLEARVHPKAAAAFVDGDVARLETTVGAIEVRVRIDDGVRPDVVLLPKGGMLRDGHCANLLIEAIETDDGGGAAYYDQPARLVRR